MPLEAGLLGGGNDLVNFLRLEKSAIWFTKYGKEDIIKLADLRHKSLRPTHSNKDGQPAPGSDSGNPHPQQVPR